MREIEVRVIDENGVVLDVLAASYDPETREMVITVADVQSADINGEDH